MKTTEAIVLAGGFGTRLQEILPETPKPMAPVQGHPFLEYQLHYLAFSGIHHVILAVGYKAEQIQSHFGTQYETLHLSYSLEEQPLGTGGALMKACESIAGDTVIALNGDTYFKTNYEALEDLFLNSGADVVLALKALTDFHRYGSVRLNSAQQVTGFSEKGYHPSGFINGGVYLLSPQLLKNSGLPSHFSFEHDYLERYYTQHRIFGHASDAYFIDIGIPEDYHRAQSELKSSELKNHD